MLCGGLAQVYRRGASGRLPARDQGALKRNRDAALKIELSPMRRWRRLRPGAAPAGDTGLVADPRHNRLTAFEVFLHIRDCMERSQPCSVVRLGDGEGALLGYPTITSRADVDRSLLTWLRTKDVPDAQVLALVRELKDVVRSADILGLPRRKQIEHHRWRAVQQAVDALYLHRPGTLATHTALHRLLQHALLYRPILQNAPFLGLISCRRLGSELKRRFNIGEVRWHGVRGELNEPGEVQTPHYPDGFHELRETLQVPFRGALFLVGAGAFGKIYCQWIKERGGIAVDIGSICDSWANVGRVGEPVRSLEVYSKTPRIRRRRAVARYNQLADDLGLDVPLGDIRASYFKMLPKGW